MLLSYPHPFYDGIATSTETRADIAIAGRPFMVDWASDQAFVMSSIPLQRAQADTADRPGEQTLNPEGLWRRSAESWHHGTGQAWVDSGEAPDPYRFADSRGVDPWTRKELRLLNDVTHAVTSADTVLPLTVAGGRVFAGDGATVRTSVNGLSWAPLTGGGAGTVRSATSDGHNAYFAYGPGIYKSVAGAALTAVSTSPDLTLLRYASGRLFGANNETVSTYDAAGADTLLTQHPNPDWRWDDITGAGWVYLLGHAGDRAAVYKTREKDDGTGLTVPVVCGGLPDGETGYALCAYLGYLVIGTSRGVRVAQLEASGDLTVGALVEIGGGVRGLEPQGQYVWFTWANPDSTSTGLGRLDLTVFVAPLAPAYASDLQAPTQGVVRAVATIAGKRVFTVAGSGVWTEAAAPVASGWLDWGRVTFGLPDTKTAMYADVRHLPLDGTVSVALGADDGDRRTLATSAVQGSVTTPYAVSAFQARGSWFRTRVTLTGNATLTRLTLRADPRAERTEQIIVTILLRDVVGLHDLSPLAYHTCDEYTFLQTIRDSRQVVAFQIPGFHSWPVVIDDTQFVLSHDQTGDGCLHQGSLTLRAKRVA